MQYCGIDIANLSSYVYLSDAQGRKLLSKEVQTSPSAFATVLRQYVKQGLKIAIEAGNPT